MYYSGHFIELGKICMKFAKFFDQNWTLNKRGDTFFCSFSPQYFTVKHSKKACPQFLITISPSFKYYDLVSCEVGTENMKTFIEKKIKIVITIVSGVIL